MTTPHEPRMPRARSLLATPTIGAIARRTAIAGTAAVANGPAMSLPATSVRAHIDKPHAPKAGPVRRQQKDWGIAGDAGNGRRSTEVGTADNMRLTPERLEVRQGEAPKFVGFDSGKVMHEFVIGNLAENAKHAELTVKFPNMEHDEPCMAHVPQGKAREIAWTFDRAGKFESVCPIAGHHPGTWSARSGPCGDARPDAGSRTCFTARRSPRLRHSASVRRHVVMLDRVKAGDQPGFKTITEAGTFTVTDMRMAR